MLIFITIPHCYYYYLCDDKGCLTHTDGLIELTLWKKKTDTLAGTLWRSFRNSVCPALETTILNGVRCKRQGLKVQFNTCLILFVSSNSPLGHTNYSSSWVRDEISFGKFCLPHNISNLIPFFPHLGLHLFHLSILPYVLIIYHPLPYISEHVAKLKYI